MRKKFFGGDKSFLDALHQISKIAGQELKTLVSMLSNSSLNFTELNGVLKTVRNLIQRRLFSICFCENKYNETLWLKYAGNYSGFVQIYDLYNPDTFLYGKEEKCRNCISARERPNIYPIYYLDVRYDATIVNELYIFLI